LNRRATASSCSVVEVIPDTYLAPLDLNEIFGRAAPVIVDLGCGDGSFTCELARNQPEKNFLGIDKMAGRVGKTSRKAAGLGNVRVLNVEIAYAVRFLLPAESVETFFLLFPDPWPKRRHHRRRLVTTNFLTSIHCALEPQGILSIATDQVDYFGQIQRAAREHPGFAIVDIAGSDLPMTKFEKRFHALGAPIHRLSLRKTSPLK